MALTVQSPDEGELPISIKIGRSFGGVIVNTPLPTGVTIATPTDGELAILGAVVGAHISGGAVVAGLI